MAPSLRVAPGPSPPRAPAAVALLLAVVGCAGSGPPPRVADAATVAGEPTEHRSALSTGVAVRWIELGDPAGEAVLFLHGYTDTSRSFLPTMRALAALRPELRLVALDLRGHGGSSLPADPACRSDPLRCFRTAELAADALALLDRLGVERAHLVGHSLGSFVAQELALTAPDRVGRVVLVATSAKPAGNPFARANLRDGLVAGPWRDALLARGLRYPEDAWERTPRDADPDAERWLAEGWVVEPGADPAHLAAILPETAATPLGTWIGGLWIFEACDNRARLADLRAPTLVLSPIQDAFFPEEPDQRELREALARASARHGTPWAWKVYGRAPAEPAGPQTDLGHNVHWAAPDAVARDLAAFLREGGEPTPDLARLAPGPAPRVEVVPGAAVVVRG